MSAATERAGVVYLNAELGGGGTISHEFVELAEAGVRRCLGAIGVLPLDRMPAPPPMHMFSVDGAGNYVYCLEDGLFEAFARLRAEGRAGPPGSASRRCWSSCCWRSVPVGPCQPLCTASPRK